MDVLLSATGILILLPLLFVVCLGLLLAQGRPIFFRQVRPGLNAKPFRMIKFRTMLNTTDINGDLLPDAERVTRIGTFLRRTSLDELPELWNVLTGKMSLVGPRPLLMEYLPRYTETQGRRHEVRPGITGLAQVSGRQSIPFSERLEKDVWYVDNLSFRGDISILWRTFTNVVRRQDVIVGQEVDAVDDLGLSVDLAKPKSSMKSEQ